MLSITHHQVNDDQNHKDVSSHFCSNDYHQKTEYTEKRRGREETEVTRRRKGGINKEETNLASNQFPKCSPLEKAMAPHSSTLAWKIPWTEESGGLQSMGSLRVKHD